MHIEENYRYLHKGRTVADTCQRKEGQEAGKEAPEVAAFAVAGKEENHAAYRHNHTDEDELGNQCAAFDFVGNPAAEWTGQSTDQRTEEGVFYGINPCELAFDQQGEACGKTDEGTESTQIKDAHNPVMLAAENHGLVFEAGFGGSQIVHAKPSG